MMQRAGIRNIAIVAHVDHGKTTLVDAMLRQSGAARPGEQVTERAMDSMDLEREKGITILAKNTAVRYGDVTINIVDTPGHADFGGEVERALTMVDGALLLVDAAEGPLPQTRFVLRKSLERRLPVVVAINKVDRGDARPSTVLDAVYELFMDLGADDSQIDFPVCYCDARRGLAASSPEEVPDAPGLKVLFELLLGHVPAPEYEEGHPFQALVANLDASPYVGRLAVCRVEQGWVRKGDNITWLRTSAAGERAPARVAELYMTEGLHRVDAAPEGAGPGDIVAIAGIADVMIGDTLADASDPRPLAGVRVDEPAISMTLGVNTSPLAGLEGNKMTARLVKGRLDAELVGNVSVRVFPTARPDTWEVQGRGELALAVLVELMRREGFELTVGKPQVLTREIDGKLHEPVERASLEVPEEYLGTITQLLAARKGRMVHVEHGTAGRGLGGAGGVPAAGPVEGSSSLGPGSAEGAGSDAPYGADGADGPAGDAVRPGKAAPAQSNAGWVRTEWLVPARGLIGLRTEFLTETRGTGLLHHVFDRWEPWAGELRGRPTGALVADRTGVTAQFALMNLQERGTLFVGPGEPVYEGMIVGENARADDLDVNACREKQLTNIRSSTAEVLVRLVPHRQLSLDQALELLRTDECVEVTPEAVRLRKVALAKTDRVKLARRAR